MTRKGGRLFALGCTGLATLVFLALTVDSHRQFGRSPTRRTSPEVTHGKDVWHKYNCINCHTLFGEGAYYAPDLTKITQHRGEPYLQAYMRDPSQFYDEQRHRRLMPKQNLTRRGDHGPDAFLDWVSKVDNQGWPPRPILVTGASIRAPTDRSRRRRRQGRRRSAPARGRSASDPIALGAGAVPLGDAGLHRLPFDRPGRQHGGPTLAGVGDARRSRSSPRPTTRARQRTPPATSASRSSSRARTSSRARCTRPTASRFMPNTYGKTLKPEQIDQLVAYLATFEIGSLPCATAPSRSPTGTSPSRWCCSGCRSSSACCRRPSTWAPIRCSTSCPSTSPRSSTPTC